MLVKSYYIPTFGGKIPSITGIQVDSAAEDQDHARLVGPRTQLVGGPETIKPA